MYVCFTCAFSCIDFLNSLPQTIWNNYFTDYFCQLCGLSDLYSLSRRRLQRHQFQPGKSTIPLLSAFLRRWRTRSDHTDSRGSAGRSEMCVWHAQKCCRAQISSAVALYSNQHLSYHSLFSERIFQLGGGELCVCLCVCMLRVMKCAA